MKHKVTDDKDLVILADDLSNVKRDKDNLLVASSITIYQCPCCDGVEIRLFDEKEEMFGCAPISGDDARTVGSWFIEAANNADQGSGVS